MSAPICAKAIVDAFNSLKSASGKPIIRSNGVKEWTVLAGLVALIPVSVPGSSPIQEAVPILLATGVKALPDTVREYSRGLFVHDMHAEMLSLRLFNWYLLDEIEKIERGEASSIVEQLVTPDIHTDSQSINEITYKEATGVTNESLAGDDSASHGATVDPYNDLFREKENQIVKSTSECKGSSNEPHAIADKADDPSVGKESFKRAAASNTITEPQTSIGRTGDAAENILDDLPSKLTQGPVYRIKEGIKLALYISEPPCGDSSMSYVAQGSEPWLKRPKIEGTPTILRGREHFDQVGMVRTKPGRVDSVMTLSKSCSDKLCVKQLTGITNAVNSCLFPEGVFLDYLVLRKDKIHKADFDRCFHTRFCDKLADTAKVHPLKLLTYDQDDYSYHKPLLEAGCTPSQLSLLYIVPRNRVEVINNGVKFGSYRKKKAPARGGESFICNAQMTQKLARMRDISEHAYYKDLKRGSDDRQRMKQLARFTLNGWEQTAPDDFPLRASV